MLQLKNQSPFAPAISLLPNQAGIDTLYVIVRATFELAPTLKLAEKQLPPVLADAYLAEPGASSLKYASELHVGKPSTDVVLIGNAWAPGGRAATESLVVLQVAERRKIVRVFGDRTWKADGFSKPEPFERMPLVYERAYGGTLAQRDPTRVLAEERNPVGVGFAGERTPSEMVGEKLPNLEDLNKLLAKPGDQVDPACFGFVAGSWLPRRSHAGTYDDAWQRKRAPYLPNDFDPRFFNCACPDMIFDRFLQGGEPVAIQGASHSGMLQFTLPRCSLQIEVKIAGRKQSPPANLETVLFEPDDNRMGLSWRAQVPCDKQPLKVEEVAVAVQALEFDAPGGRR
jgi:hypothetical protein